MYRPGDDLGRYRIVETIGLGGMGVVYRGRDTVLGRDVAIKAMTGNVASDPRLRRRFLQELENAPRVVHPFVTTVFDVIDRAEGPLLVMERVEGTRFDHFVAETNPPLATIARLGAEMAEALAAIHAVGMVHRDLKPGNVLVTADGHPKVMDFGVALRLPGFDRTDLVTHQSAERQTDAGAVVGTIAYMSPEQLRGEEPGERSDLFALGIMLCEGVTGHHPFPGETSAETAGAILHAPPGSDEDRHKLQECGSLGTTILRLLEKNPRDRIRDAREAARLLHAATAHWTSPGLPARRRLVRSFLASALALLAIGGAMYTFRDTLFGGGSKSKVVEGTGGVRPAVAVLPFESAAGGPGEAVGLMVADLLAAQLGESSRLRPIATDRVAECLAALPAGTSPSARRSGVAQSTPAAWIVSGTLYNESGDLLAAVSVFARDGSDPASSFQVRANRPSQLATRAFEHLQESTGAAELAGFLPARAAPVFPADPETAVLLRRAREAARTLDYTRGIDLLEDALRRDASFLDAQILLAELLDRAGYERRADQVADQAIALAKSSGLPKDARQSLQARAAKARVAAGPSFVAVLRELADRYPDEPQVLRDLAMAIRRTAPDEAAAVIARAIEVDPSDGRSYLVLSRVLTEQKRAQDALLAVGKAEQSFKSYGASVALGEAAQARGYAFLQSGNLDAARDAMRAARTLFESAERPVAALVATAEEADIELRRYRIEAAGGLFAQAIPGLKAAGHYSRIVNALSGFGASLMRDGRNPQAEAAFTQATDLARSLDNPTLIALPLVNLSSLYTQVGRYAEAKALAAEVLGQAAGEIPDGLRCSATLTGAIAEAGLGHLGRAIEQLDRHVSSNLATCGTERIANAAAQAAWFAFQTGAPSAALSSLDRAIGLIDGPKAPPDLAFYCAERARVRAWLGRQADAWSDLERAEKIAGDPKGRGMSLGEDLRLARASIALYRGDANTALEESAVPDAGSGDLRAALILLRGEALLATKRTAEARRLLASAGARAIAGAADRLGLRYLEAALSLAEGRRADALSLAQAALDDPVTSETRLLAAKFADLAARATADPAKRASFVARRDAVVLKILEVSPAESRAWVAAHWGQPGPTPEPARPSP